MPDPLESNVERLVRRHGVRLDPERVDRSCEAFLRRLRGGTPAVSARRWVLPGLAASAVFAATLWLALVPSREQAADWSRAARLVEPAAPPLPPSGNAAFRDVTAATGLGAAMEAHVRAFPRWTQAGMTFADLDGDGALDLHLASLDPAAPALLASNHGFGRFARVEPGGPVPRRTRISHPLPYPGGMIRLAGDLDEDGALDLFAAWHGNGGELWLNRSRTGFEPIFEFRRAPFLDDEFPALRHCAFADLDGDGRVDLLRNDESARARLHRGRGDGTFDPKPALTLETGLPSGGVIPVDLDGDGDLDLLCRRTGFTGPDGRRIFRNDGNLKFSAATAEFGLDENGSIHGTGDLNHDGAPDLVCVEGAGVEIYLNDGAGRFARRAGAVRGLERAPWKPHAQYGRGWGGAAVTDFDNDGAADVIVNGKFFLYVLRGLGNGDFEYANDRWALPSVSYCTVDDGVCFGDFDGDGRLDVVAATGRQGSDERTVGLFRNELRERGWLRVQLSGRPGNRMAAGARIRLTEPGTGRLLWSEQISAWNRQSFHSYYAQASTERHFGLGERAAADVRVDFPSGRSALRRGVPANATVLVREE